VQFDAYVAMTRIEQWIREEGRKEGMALGVEKGKIESKRETARAALAEGLSPELVAKITSLSLDEVLAIKREMDN